MIFNETPARLMPAIITSEDNIMRTLFRKLMVPLLFFISILAASSASATVYKVADYAVYKFNGGDYGYIKVTGADCVGFKCYFQLNALGTSMVMALATAKQMQIGIYLHGNAVDGPRRAAENGETKTNEQNLPCMD